MSTASLKHTEYTPVRTKSVTLIDPEDDKKNYKTKGSSRKLQAAESDYETQSQQTTPMLSRGGATEGDLGHRQAAAQLSSYQTGRSNQSVEHLNNSTGVMDLGGPPKQPSPTSTLAWCGFGLSVFALTCMCLSFASPYWLQQWDLSFSTFENMGLWEVCFHNYMHHRDDLQEIYNGCFWVFNSDEKYSKLRDWLLPPWFLACQVMATAILLVEISVVIVTALVFLHMCPLSNHEYHQIFAMFISGALMFLCTMTSLIVAVLFGVQIQDRNWMPRPDWNFLSWGYGFLIISGMMSLAAGFALFIAAWKAYNKLVRLQDDYFKQAMEVSQMYPQSYSQASYGPGDRPSDSAQPSYASQPSYEKSGYDPSTSSYPEKARSVQQSYDPGQYGRQASADPSYDQSGGSRGYKGGHEGQQSYGGQQRGYDPDRSYDSNRSFEQKQYGGPVSYDQYGSQSHA